jgi:hypothetical protein
MEAFFRFVQQSGRERNRLIHEACAGDGVVRPTPISEQSNQTPTDRATSGINAGVVS